MAGIEPILLKGAEILAGLKKRAKVFSFIARVLARVFVLVARVIAGVFIKIGQILLILGYCPLTKIEEKLRRQMDKDFTYNNNFTVFHVNKIFGLSMSTKKVNGYIIAFHIISYTAAGLILTY